jgi:hypothetical protein
MCVCEREREREIHFMFLSEIRFHAYVVFIWTPVQLQDVGFLLLQLFPSIFFINITFCDLRFSRP